MFNATRGSVQSYIAAPNYTLYSGATFHLDYGWNRIVYYERLNSWIRSYSKHGNNDSELNRPNSIDAHAINDAFGGNYNYEIFIADTKNDRISRFKYNWQTEAMVSIPPITAVGLNNPIDLDINNGGTFGGNVDDYLWVINKESIIQRFTVDGVLQSSFSMYGCDGQVGFFCNPTAIVSGRSDLLTAPYNPYAHTRFFYVADAGNNRIVWLLKDEFSETISWLGEVATTSTIVDLEVDNFGHLWAVDEENGSITKYSYDLFPLCTFGSSGTGENQFFKPKNISNIGGYLASGNMSVTESWEEESGLQYFTIGTDLVDFWVSSNQDDSRHFIDYVLVDPSIVIIEIWKADSNGLMKAIRYLHDGTQFSGKSTIIWDGKDDFGQEVPVGYCLVKVIAKSTYGSAQTTEPVNIVSKELWNFHTPSCCIGIRGNVDGDSQELVDIGDTVYLTEFMFQGGPPPSCYEEGNVDGDPQDIVDISDLVYLIDFTFSNPIGPEPPSCY